jgi:membrane-bound ClpP family serine protease|tara:strand:+ start:434 stop:919 length:486 start_codon:yes stop_codon:yes gene_type:complete
LQKPINLDWIIILILIVFGISLLIIEVIFIPGTTLVGIGGIICLIFGIYFGFDYYGTTIGFLILGMTLIIITSSFIYSLKAKPWEQFSLKETMTSTVNEEIGIKLIIGNIGLTTSDLKPVGKALFENEEIEVCTQGDFLSTGKEVKIIKIDHNKIYVQLNI